MIDLDALDERQYFAQIAQRPGIFTGRVTYERSSWHSPTKTCIPMLSRQSMTNTRSPCCSASSTISWSNATPRTNLETSS